VGRGGRGLRRLRGLGCAGDGVRWEGAALPNPPAKGAWPLWKPLLIAGRFATPGAEGARRCGFGDLLRGGLGDGGGRVHASPRPNPRGSLKGSQPLQSIRIARLCRAGGDSPVGEAVGRRFLSPSPRPLVPRPNPRGRLGGGSQSPSQERSDAL
jgi:hypothetical protein